MEGVVSVFENTKRRLHTTHSWDFIGLDDGYTIVEIQTEPSSVKKIMEIDEHIGCAMSGLIADARTRVEHARVETQNRRFSYGEPMTVESTTQALCDLALRFGGVEESMSHDTPISHHDTPISHHVNPAGSTQSFDEKDLDSSFSGDNDGHWKGEGGALKSCWSKSTLGKQKNQKNLKGLSLFR